MELRKEAGWHIVMLRMTPASHQRSKTETGHLGEGSWRGGTVARCGAEERSRWCPAFRLLRFPTGYFKTGWFPWPHGPVASAPLQQRGRPLQSSLKAEHQQKQSDLIRLNPSWSLAGPVQGESSRFKVNQALGAGRMSSPAGGFGAGWGLLRDRSVDGDARPASWRTLKGFKSTSPRLRGTSYLGNPTMGASTLKGLRPSQRPPLDSTPVGLSRSGARTQGCPNPGLDDGIPLGFAADQARSPDRGQSSLIKVNQGGEQGRSAGAKAIYRCPPFLDSPMLRLRCHSGNPT